MIVLATLNAKYIHASFGLRYLHANLGALRDQAQILEFEISHRPIDVVERILAQKPSIVGFGVYIWNTTQTFEVVALLRRVAPQLVVVLGGPEVSYELDDQPLVALADYIITGEADHAFRTLCERLVAGERPTQKIIYADPPQPETLELPYDLYSENDAAHRVIYVEASRGCPFTCEFCLSSLEIPVRQFDLDKLLQNFEQMLARGVRQFKFVDRTFNLNIKFSRAILEFFLARYSPGLFVHFEMVPDRFPEQLREVIAKFPAGSIQLEVGIQTFNPVVGGLISRRQNYEKLEENLLWLRSNTGVHVHADLIIGLPGESLESFAAGFDRLVQINPQEIQVGILKRLRGTPIVRHTEEWQMVYSPLPPYEILSNRLIDFATMQRLRRFARFWDLVGNSGNFMGARSLLWGQGSAFFGFLAFSDWIATRARGSSGIALKNLARYLFEYLTEVGGVTPEQAGGAIAADFARLGREDLPRELASYRVAPPHRRSEHGVGDGAERDAPERPVAPERQSRFL